MSRRTGLLAGLLVAALGAPALAATTAAPAPSSSASSSTAVQRWLVTAQPDALPALRAALAARGATVVRDLGSVGTLVVQAPAGAVAGLPGARTVTRDGRLSVLADSWDPKTDTGSAWSVTRNVGARTAWAGTEGVPQATGRGVDVALIDTGVTRVPGLDGAGKVVDGPDLSFDSQSDDTAHRDTFGHGTHMAGLIAGRDAGADPARPGGGTDFLGVAPDARIVNVKVGDGFGNADVSQVIAGIDWVVQKGRRDGLAVRVLNLSLGLPSTQDTSLDPLAFAAEQAWHRGIVVVASVGNDGTGTGALMQPARDPYVIAVGADDSKGTNTTDDDVVPAFSTRGDGRRNPDVVAPGRSLQSLRVPGSFVDRQAGSGRLGERYQRGSGTSQAAAVVSGVVALMLQQRPDLTPDQVKALLVRTARRLPAADPQAQGAGIVDVRRAATAAVPTTTQDVRRATGTGSLDAARGGLRVRTEDGVELTGERDVMGAAYDGRAHAALGTAAWSGGTWNGTRWAGGGTADTGWATATWANDWSGRAWAERSWSGGTWNGQAWASGYWQGQAWAGQSWAGQAWAGQAWAGQAWAGQAWAGQAWAGGTWD